MGDHSGKTRVVSDNVITALSQELDGAGTFVGRRLGISESVIQGVQKDHQGNTAEINYQLLLKWKRQNGSKATRACLVLALKKSHRKDLAEKFFKGSSAKTETAKAAGKNSEKAGSSKEPNKKKIPVPKNVSTAACGSRAKKAPAKRKSTTKMDPSKRPKQKKTPAVKTTPPTQSTSAQKHTAKRKSTSELNPSKGPKQRKVPAKKPTTSVQNSSKKKETAKRGSTAKQNPPKDSQEKLTPAVKTTPPTQSTSSAQNHTAERKSTSKLNPSKGPKQRKVPAKKPTTSVQKTRKKKETAKRGSTAKTDTPKDSEEKLFAEIGRAVWEETFEQLSDTSDESSNLSYESSPSPPSLFPYCDT